MITRPGFFPHRRDATPRVATPRHDASTRECNAACHVVFRIQCRHEYNRDILLLLSQQRYCLVLRAISSIRKEDEQCDFQFSFAFYLFYVLRNRLRPKTRPSSQISQTVDRNHYQRIIPSVDDGESRKFSGRTWCDIKRRTVTRVINSCK